MNRYRFKIGFVILVLGAVACSPPVALPAVQTPLDSVAWENCAADAQARAGRSMIDDMKMDADLLICKGVVMSNDEAKVDEAVEMLTESAVTDKEDYRAYFLSARVLTQAGRYEEALTHFARAQKRNSKIDVPTVKFGKKVIEKYGELEGMVFLDKAKRRGFCGYGCKGMLANLYQRQNRIDDAKELYEEMLDENDGQPEAYIGLALMENSEKNYNKEAKLLKKAMNTKGFETLSKPKRAEVYHNRAYALYNAKKYVDAQKVLDDAVGFKQSAQRSLLAGWIQLKLGDSAMALIQFEKALDKDKKLAAAHVGVGDASKALGSLNDAQKAYAQAAYLNPLDGVVKLKLAAIYIEKKDFDNAKIQLSDAKKLGTEKLPQELLTDVTDAIAAYEK